MPRQSLKKKGCKNNMSKKILNLINTKIDLVQETLDKLVNKEDSESVIPPTSDTLGSYQSDMNVGEPNSSLTDNASYESNASTIGMESPVSTDASATMVPDSDASATMVVGSDASATVVPESDASATVVPESDASATVVPASSEVPGSEVPAGSEAPVSSEAPGSEASTGSEAPSADNSSLPEGVGHGQYSQDSFFEGKYHDEKPQQTTGGKRRTNKRNKRRNMKSRRRS
jgi:hypothetical protein